MHKSETNIVKPDPGRNSPDRCYYCHEPVGQEHQPTCVMREKTVTLEMWAEIVVTVPQSWDEDAVEFKYNESTFCANNIIEGIESNTEKGHGAGCWCGVFTFTYLRDATAKDEKSLPFA